MHRRIGFLAAIFVVSVATPAFSATDGRFDSNGVQLHFVTSGQGEAVILLHGFSGSAAGAWIKPGTFDALASGGFRVIALDHRGHGQSGKPHDAESYGVEMAEDLRRLLDHLDIDRAHIVGYSMGAKIANTFRARHPNRLLTLTLGGYGWPWRSRDVSLEQARQNMALRAIPPGNDLDALAAYRVRSNDLMPTESNLRANEVPSLSLVGTEDEAVSREDLAELRATMSNLASVDMPGTHAGPDGALYKPQFAAEVISFIRGHPAP